MFNGIEFVMGAVCSLMGIFAGYLLLTSVFAGIQFISKQRIKQKVGKTLDT